MEANDREHAWLLNIRAFIRGLQATHRGDSPFSFVDQCVRTNKQTDWIMLRNILY